MAKSITLTSGSILNGNPITLAVKPDVLKGTPSFHRVILEVECGITGGNYEVIKMSAPVPEESSSVTITIDISSALRTFRDTYEYTPYSIVYPLVKFNVKAYDEYMVDGEVHTLDGVVFYPQNPALLSADRRDEAYLRTIFGAFSDIERITSRVTRGVTNLSRKPTTIPQIVTVGETFADPIVYPTEQKLEQSNTLVAPMSKFFIVQKDGAQLIGFHKVYALPASEAKNRQVFRFINGFGVLESISVPRVYSKKLAVTSTPYVVARQETFNQFSRSAIRKQNNRESWLFQSDPLDEAWLQWYIHEFLMSEHVWMQAPSSSDLWLPVTITPEEETTFLDRTQNEAYQVAFTAQLDINGSPLL